MRKGLRSRLTRLALIFLRVVSSMARIFTEGVDRGRTAAETNVFNTRIQERRCGSESQQHSRQITAFLAGARLGPRRVAR